MNFHFFVFLFIAAWLIFDAFAVKKDIDQGLGGKKAVLDFFLGLPIAAGNAIKKLIGKK